MPKKSSNVFANGVRTTVQYNPIMGELMLKPESQWISLPGMFVSVLVFAAVLFLLNKCSSETLARIQVAWPISMLLSGAVYVVLCRILKGKMPGFTGPDDKAETPERKAPGSTGSKDFSDRVREEAERLRLR